MRKTECLDIIVSASIDALYDNVLKIKNEIEELQERYSQTHEDFIGIRDYYKSLTVADIERKRKLIEIDKFFNRSKS